MDQVDTSVPLCIAEANPHYHLNREKARQVRLDYRSVSTSKGRHRWILKVLIYSGDETMDSGLPYGALCRPTWLRPILPRMRRSVA